MDVEKRPGTLESEKGVRYLEKAESDVDVTIDLDDSIEYTDATLAVWLITFTVSMGGFLFG